MADTTLRDLVLKQLEADTQAEDEWSALVLAALEGQNELDLLLAAGNRAPTKAPPQDTP
jgi:hypothetical protein